MKIEYQLTHRGRVTHICVSKLTIIGSDNGLLPGRRQAIIWTNAGILLIGPVGTNFSEILIEIYTFSFKKVRLKISSAKWRPCCLGLNVLTGCIWIVLLLERACLPWTHTWFLVTHIKNALFLLMTGSHQTHIVCCMIWHKIFDKYCGMIWYILINSPWEPHR